MYVGEARLDGGTNFAQELRCGGCDHIERTAQKIET